MPELLISEITRMGEGFCVIGLLRNQSGSVSLRPIPPGRYAWQPFPYQRADRVDFELYNIPVARPHVEDRQSRNHSKVGSISEADMVDCLKQAEVAASIKELFGCNVRSSPRGGAAVHVKPEEGNRSICGCAIENISFSLNYYPPKIRATLYLESGDRLDSLPVVDDDWLRFADRLWEQNQGTANVQQRLQRFFNWQIREHLLSSPASFARIGLARPDRDGLCWLMLDSVFPLPKKQWSEEFT
ncbi:MAG: hypothetical protein ACRD2Q_09050 [Terriglobales bacterium]